MASLGPSQTPMNSLVNSEPPETPRNYSSLQKNTSISRPKQAESTGRGSEVVGSET